MKQIQINAQETVALLFLIRMSTLILNHSLRV